VNVQVVSKACAGEPDGFDGVTHLVITASSQQPEGSPGHFPPITATRALGDRRADLPGIPVGAGRLLTIAAHSGDPAPGNLVAWGSSRPFELPASGRTVSVTVVVRGAGRFATATDRDGTCRGMGTPRAGHSATLLADGRVLIAGGFNSVKDLRDPSCAPTFWTCRDFLNTTEIFDPAAASPETISVAGGEMAEERAQHAAVLLPQQPGDRAPNVLITGGENVTAGTIHVLRGAEIYDPVGNQFGRDNMAVRRSRHTATAAHDAGGAVRGIFLAGGVNSYGGVGGAPVATSTTEWYDPSDAAVHFKPSPALRALVGGSPQDTGRFEHAAVSWGDMVAVVGGSDDAQIFATFVLFRWVAQPPGFERLDDLLTAPTFVLAQGRFGLSAAVVPGQPGKIAVAGGHTQLDKQQQSQTVELADLSQPGLFPAPSVVSTTTARAGGCLVALPGGKLILLGGWSAALGGARGDAWLLDGPTGLGASEVTPGGPASPRHDMACTPLGDGSVLVTGGVVDDGAQAVVTTSAEIYTPRF
jgi:hypothetical protein